MEINITENMVVVPLYLSKKILSGKWYSCARVPFSGQYFFREKGKGREFSHLPSDNFFAIEMERASDIFDGSATAFPCNVNG